MQHPSEQFVYGEDFSPSDVVFLGANGIEWTFVMKPPCDNRRVAPMGEEEA